MNFAFILAIIRSQLLIFCFGTSTLTRTFFFRARRVKLLFQLLSGVLNTHRNLLPAISPLPCREIGFRVIAKLVGTVLVLLKTPKPDGSQCQRFPFLSGISLSGNRHIRDVAVHLHHKSPNPELRYARALSPCHVTSSLHSIGNRVIAISKVAIPLHWKIPNVEPRLPGISCHVSP
jgi:hypothetical protein